MTIQILYFPGCPNHEPARQRLLDALQTEGIDVHLEEIEVTDAATAQRLRFLGSPTIRLNDRDIEPDAHTLQNFGLGCRTYLDQGRRSGLPSDHVIRQALLEGATINPELPPPPSRRNTP